MATKKRKSTARRAASRKKQAQQRLPAGLGTLFAGLLLVVLAFVQGDSVWRVLHDVLFGLFGCGSFVLGAAGPAGSRCSAFLRRAAVRRFVDFRFFVAILLCSPTSHRHNI